MLKEQIKPYAARALEICGIYRKTEELFGCGEEMSYPREMRNMLLSINAGG